MLAEIITIGDEILIGQIVDTNSAWIAQQLNNVGISVHQISSVSDSHKHILTALHEAQSRVKLVLITGGLGPTKDDITKKCLAEYFGCKMSHHAMVLANLRRLLNDNANNMLALNREQALVPECATIINNEVGTAPCMWFERGDTVFVSMPGVPAEMKWLMQHRIIPKLTKHFNRPVIVHKTVLTHGLPESVLAERISKWEDQIPQPIKLAYLPSAGVIRLRLSATGSSAIIINKQIDAQIELLKRCIPDLIFGYGIDTLQEVVGRLLKQQKQTLSTAESCTGGSIAKLMTSIAGSSAYYSGSVVAYSNALKQQVLAVEPAVIETHGAVSQEVVIQMAKGVRKLMQTDWAIATSGIAGPDGGSADKPVGTTWIAVSGPNGTVAQQFVFSKNRERNIRWASLSAINMLRQALEF